jgi:putative glutamine amidotransferase
VNSTHHQAVREVAAPLRVTARSPDGVVEGMELGLAEGHLLPYLLAVQFHPERLIPQFPEFIEVFRTFVNVCALVRKKSI